MSTTTPPVVATCNRAELGTAVNWVYSGLPSHLALPILGAVRVTVDNDGDSSLIELATFDYETMSIVTVAADRGSDFTGDLLVDGRKLRDVIGSLPEGARTEVRLAVEEAQLKIDCGTVSAVVPAMPGDEYPGYPDMPEVAGVFDGPTWADYTGVAARLAGTDDTLPALLCVQITPGADTAVMECTDRYRLARLEVPWIRKTDREAPWHVKAKLLTRFTRKANTKAGRVYLLGGADTDWAGLTDGTVTLLFQPLRDVTFPPIGKMIRSSSRAVWEVDGGKLDAACRWAAKLLARDKHGMVELLPKDGGLLVSVFSESAERLGAQEIEQVTVTGDDQVVTFNPVFLASVTRGLTGPVSIGVDRGTTERGVQPVQVTCEDWPGMLTATVPLRWQEKPASAN